MVVVAQLVRALVCGTRGRGFEPHLPPKEKTRKLCIAQLFLLLTRCRKFICRHQVSNKKGTALLVFSLKAPPQGSPNAVRQHSPAGEGLAGWLFSLKAPRRARRALRGNFSTCVTDVKYLLS
jgi:hypothetical protein